MNLIKKIVRGLNHFGHQQKNLVAVAKNLAIRFPTTKTTEKKSFTSQYLLPGIRRALPTALIPILGYGRGPKELEVPIRYQMRYRNRISELNRLKLVDRTTDPVILDAARGNPSPSTREVIAAQ